MPRKHVTVGAILLISAPAIAQQRTYSVKEGDTLSQIASKVGVKTKAIAWANGLKSVNSLKPGMVLKIPNDPKYRLATASVVKALPHTPFLERLYVVRNGDNDWTIARRFGLSVYQLQHLNPGVSWKRLQIGTKLQLGAAPKGTNEFAHLIAKATQASQPVVKAKTYSIRQGDNDWVIARRSGITVSQIHSLNPNIQWDRLQIGQTIRLPQAAAAKATIASHTIRGRYVAVRGSGVTVRRGPTVASGKVVQVDSGTVGAILDRENGWYKLKFPHGTAGWVRADLLTSVTAREVAAQFGTRQRRTTNAPTLVASKSGRMVASKSGDGLLDTAYSMLGTRYRYGAMSRSATDCSGFTKQVFSAKGVQLPRTSKEQSGVGNKVPKGDLKKGDLVFFKTNRGSRINHVGIYAGNGKFIHSSSGKGHVRVDTLTEGYYASRFAGARRVLKSPATSSKSTSKSSSSKAASASKSSAKKKSTKGADAVAQ